jgi:hypothetical protein
MKETIAGLNLRVCPSVKICRFAVSGLAYPKHYLICFLRTNHKNCGFAICGLTHLTQLRNSDIGISTRICGFAICRPKMNRA